MMFTPDPAILQCLAAQEASFVLTRDGIAIHSVFGRGIGPALAALDAKPPLLPGACVYDTIVGKAAAALFVLGGVQAVYGGTMSEAAIDLLTQSGIVCRWGVCTAEIINRRGDGLCPFEQAVLPCRTPQDCLPIIRQTLARLRAGTGPVK